MDQVLEFLLSLVAIVIGPIRAVANAVIAVVNWPATMLGIAPEIMATILCCLVLLAAWRALGPVIK